MIIVALNEVLMSLSESSCEDDLHAVFTLKTFPYLVPLQATDTRRNLSHD